MRREDRAAVLIGLRVGGGVLLLLGLWMALGGSLAGRYGFGTVLVVAGAIGAILVPALLGRRWR